MKNINDYRKNHADLRDSILVEIANPKPTPSFVLLSLSNLSENQTKRLNFVLIV